ncbi:MAG: hypothetical protein HY901_22180 [Deltaproteobacteria bacterium]|nr:hypothetical protein [Deltaproteobacteria bacterium]
MSEPLIVEQGFLFAYRMYDVADEIDLEKAVALSKQAATRLKLSREGSQYLEMPNPPVAFLLGHRPLALKAGALSAEVVARLFDHGAVSIQLQLPIAPGTSLGDLAALTDEIYSSAGVDLLARQEAEALSKSIAGAFTKPHFWEGSEDYHVIFIDRFQTQPLGEEILAQGNLARLILGETGKALSEHEQWDVTKHAFSYFADDLAVVDWNAAFVYEPSGSRDIPDLLEIATAQLLELRYYDDVLDRELGRLYDTMEKKRHFFASVFRSKYGDLRREVMVLMLEIAEFTERVENSLKVIGDFYLARVYRAAVRRFRVPAWQESVDRKEGLVRQIYELLHGEAEHGRMFLLELTVVILIAFEIVMALFKFLPH